ncbi:NIPSNAP family protein [Actinomadura viridis]|uniref:NIPSNAP family protein n=1 Tax=Actinomadura viridis TaxID=58110 RepID=UPI003683F62C
MPASPSPAVRPAGGRPIVELRRYTLRPGERDTLIELFDREFVETQEAVGIDVVGQFRDEDDPDRFVWLRSFPDMRSRAESLTAFYLEGEAWKAHASAAGATMLDSSDVLLLRPSAPGAGFRPRDGRPPVGSARPPSRLMVTLYFLNAPADDAFLRFFDAHVSPLMAETGAAPIATLVTEPAENTFPRLPVREGENVFAWFAAFENADRLREHRERLARSPAWTVKTLPRLIDYLSAPAEQWRLAPTARSLLR